MQCIQDIDNYITQYIFQGYVMDYNVFIKAMKDYGEHQNKLGYELYNNQVDYL